jgi:acetyl esterase/lipase
MRLYRDMDRAALDAAYNNSAAVADSANFITDWDERSAAVAAARPQHLDLTYGPRERNRIDYFAGKKDAPVLAFIHGGYWQMRAKETFRFVAEGPLAHGFNVALIAYTLAPEAGLREIVDEVRAAIDYLHANAGVLGFDSARLYVSGWSAGGHLTAATLDHPAVRGGVAISGIFDLEPIRLSYLNDKLRLDEADVTALSPLRNLPQASPPLFVVHGTAELAELQRQARELAAARAEARLPGRLVPLEGHNHFTILEELASPDGAITQLVMQLS